MIEYDQPYRLSIVFVTTKINEVANLYIYFDKKKKKMSINIDLVCIRSCQENPYDIQIYCINLPLIDYL